MRCARCNGRIGPGFVNAPDDYACSCPPPTVEERLAHKDHMWDRMRHQRDEWIRRFNELENAISHHQRDALLQLGPDCVEPWDEALWKKRDQVLYEATHRTEDA